MKILVPIDASPQTEYTLEFLASRTTLLGSNPTIELLNVQQPLPAPAAWSVRKRSPATTKTNPKRSSNPPASP